MYAIYMSDLLERSQLSCISASERCGRKISIMALPHQLTLKALIAPLLVLNFGLYAVLLGIAGWAYNKNVESSIQGSNKVTKDLITYTLIAGVLGIASVLSGLRYLLKWSPESKASAAATAIVALPVTLLALGVASKHVHVGHGHNRKLKTLESFAIILGATQFLYTLLVHGIFGEDKIMGYTAPAPAAEPTKEVAPEAPPVAAKPAEAAV